MKKRISDMLDGFLTQSVEMENSTPLSSERIKELTMSKINHHTEKKGKRIVFRVLVVAAALSLITMTAFAAEEIFGAGDWFRGILNDQLKEDQALAEVDGLDVTVQETITEDQIEIINSMGQVFEEKSITSQGTTMTMTAAYADANVMHMYLQVVAPEGTVLPDNTLYKFYDPDHYGAYEEKRWGPLELGEDAPYEVAGFQLEEEALPDEDPTDNKKDFHIILYKQPGMDMKLNDGVTKLWHSDGIYQQVVDTDGDEDSFVQLAAGEFAFDISLANDVEVVELDVAGLTYGGTKNRTWTHRSECSEGCQDNLTGEVDADTGLPIHSESWEYTVTARSLTISPLSVEWECEYTCSDENVYPGLAYQIVMKDGTSPVGRDQGGMEGEDCSSGTIIYDVPIDLDEIDYILIGDPDVGSTHKVYLP